MRMNATFIPLSSGERVSAKRAGEGDARGGRFGKSSTPSPQPSPRRGEGASGLMHEKRYSGSAVQVRPIVSAVLAMADRQVPARSGGIETAKRMV
ncbi:hypothetical protein GAY33_14575 [Azospirillum brasilense]|nr:hypothetical protein [Azospirillum argentinense]